MLYNIFRCDAYLFLSQIILNLYKLIYNIVNNIPSQNSRLFTIKNSKYIYK